MVITVTAFPDDMSAFDNNYYETEYKFRMTKNC